MFITVEDETEAASLVLWPDRFEKQRRLVLSARMIACHGRIQRKGEVVHVVTDQMEDLSGVAARRELAARVGESRCRHGTFGEPRRVRACARPSQSRKAMTARMHVITAIRMAM